MTSDILSEMIELYELYPDMDSRPSEKVIERFKSAIELRPVNTQLIDPVSGRVRESTIGFLLAFEYSNAKVAKTVADNLVSLFLDKNKETRTARVEQTSSFLGKQADTLSAQVEEREKALEVFKAKNAGKLPELQDVNLQIVAKNERQLVQVSEDLRSLREQAASVQAELSVTSRTGMLISSTGERILTNSEKMKTLRTELADAKRRYSNNHPDVKRLRRQLKEAQAGEGNEDADFLSSAETAPDNPAYIQLSSKLNSIRSEISALNRREARLNSKISRYEKSLTEAPAIEREYLALTRDYDNIVDKYRDTKRRVLEAQLSESAEKGNHGDRFTILETPRVSAHPVRPNRQAILIIGFLLATLIGSIVVILADQLDRSVRNASDLIKLIDQQPIAVIGYIDTGADIWRRRALVLLMFLILVGGALTAYMVYQSRVESDSFESAAITITDLEWVES
jgi:uncharacterized protein involved in exopolysaccharide biosynthesis